MYRGILLYTNSRNFEQKAWEIDKSSEFTIIDKVKVNDYDGLLSHFNSNKYENV